MDHSTANDGITHINIGTTAQTALGRELSYYRASSKTTPEGQRFRLYAGYYFYLITNGDHPRFLRAKRAAELKPARSIDWTNVPGIHTHLESVLGYNLRVSLMAIPMLRKTDPLPIVWEEPDRPLKVAEKRWLRVVQNVVHRLRCEYA